MNHTRQSMHNLDESVHILEARYNNGLKRVRTKLLMEQLIQPWLGSAHTAADFETKLEKALGNLTADIPVGAGDQDA